MRLSELDQARRQNILELITNTQTVLTAVELDGIPKELLKEANVVEL